MHEARQQVVDSALENLLGHLPPEVAERVHAKYSADREAFIAYVDSILPSKDPKYWAKSSCTKCCGRGILGILKTPLGVTETPACPCTAKKYSKWLVEARKAYNTTKGTGTHETTAD